MSKWTKWDIFSLVAILVVGVIAITITWVDTELPSRLNFTLWVGLATIWAVNAISSSYRKGK